ncbi:oxidoreductase domain protein [Beutenbergia cavernae DSM 12333]|uniref:Oxidoreductase domain protein n=1 Tax=Beutenbergia cavernae (strain ATCC BAA-8 / DSM 12333 / CCUG 43141 / JCM 11478 / NBRC 16432 / NCIMB 13614 / HKI 0122) TaxID=471853 RepID=C5BVD1_BEUC1|nr:Gfo/Idh/MocA family oxidoreductase [Beutenbergia cavernae]ACQ80518.1 oxidoreductase domain protein [Beutenbergia cavernae DSM 12333]
MTDERLRVAVVGAGGWGRQHVRAFSAREDVRVVGVAARTLAHAEQRAAGVGARGYDDVDRMLDVERPDLVSVCLPNTAHYAPTLHLLERGVPLLVEKPLAFDLDEGRRLVAEAERRGTFFAINFNHRFATPVRMARAAVDAGELGRLSFATWRFGGEGGTGSGPDGNLIETQCHGFDMLEHLAGPISSVSAEFTQFPDRGHSTVSIALAFASGAVGSLVGSYDTSYAYPETHRLELDGDGGRALVVDTVRRFELARTGETTRRVWEAGYFDDRGRAFEATFDDHLDALIPALRAGGEPPVHARAGLRALELAHAAIRSYATGRRESVPSE